MHLLYPWFLLAMVAIMIPVIIHLLQLRRTQRVLFTNISLIKVVDLIAARHRKVKHIVLLLARVLAVVSLVLVFCQPFFPLKINGDADSLNSHVLVDNSFSMQSLGITQASLLQEEVSAVGATVNSLPGEGKLVLLNSGKAQLNKAEFANKLGDLTFSPLNPLEKAKGEILSQQDLASPLYIFSDFQKEAFNSHWLDSAGVTKQVVLVPISGKKAGNVYVDSVWLDDAFVRMRINVGLHTRLRNGGDALVQDCPVKVFFGKKQVAAFQVTLAPKQALSFVVEVQLDNDELAQCRVVTEDAPVTFDNTYYFTMQPAARINVYEIAPEPLTQKLYANEPLFNYSFALPNRVNYGIMRQANLVLLREVGEVAAGLREGLRDVLKRGGNVVVVPPGSEAGRASYQQLFSELGMGTVRWEPVTAVKELRELAIPDAQEPFFRDVFGAQQRLVTMPRAAPVLQWNRSGADVLRFRDGSKYLAEFRKGPGRAFVFAAPFAKEFSDVASHALFLPIMYRMGMLSYHNEQLPSYRLTQDGLTLSLPPTQSQRKGSSANDRAGEAGLRLVKDSLVLIPTQRVVGQEVRLGIPKGMDSPGFYQVQLRGETITTLAFNQDTKESELAAYSAAELRTLIGPNRPNIQVLEGDSGESAATALRQQSNGWPLWRYCLGFALICLFAEVLIVRFGGKRTKAIASRMAT